MQEFFGTLELKAVLQNYGRISVLYILVVKE